MGIFSKKRLAEREPSSLDSAERSEVIKGLERERQRINLEIEEVLHKYANESGNRFLKKKKRRFGSSQNDWNI